MANSSLLINQGTNAAVNFDSSGGTNTQVTAIGYGTISTIGTLPNVPNGTIGLIQTVNQVGTLPNILGGTITNLVSGTINAATAILNSGTITTGTLLSSGSATGLGTVTNLGSVTNLGQLYNAGTLQNQLAGTLTALQNGTIVAGTLTNLISGTINAATVTLNSGTINVGTVVIPSGTITTGTILSSGTTTGVGTVTNLGQLYNAGTVQNQLAGTLTALQNGTITAGTVSVAVGTINHGTIDGGTIQLNPLTATNTISHAGTSGTTAIGTLVAAATFGAGTAGYITHFNLIAISGTLEMILAFGSQTNGNQVIHHGLFAAGGGIATDITYPHGYGTTNSPVTYQILSGSGTASWDVNFFPHT